MKYFPIHPGAWFSAYFRAKFYKEPSVGVYAESWLLQKLRCGVKTGKTVHLLHEMLCGCLAVAIQRHRFSKHVSMDFLCVDSEGAEIGRKVPHKLKHVDNVASQTLNRHQQGSLLSNSVWQSKLSNFSAEAVFLALRRIGWSFPGYLLLGIEE